MKRVLMSVLVLLALGPVGSVFPAPNAETLRAALPEGYELISVDPESVPLAGRVRDPDGQVLTAYLIRNPEGQWVASSNPHYFRSLDNVFVHSEQKIEEEIAVIRQRELERERDQRLADEIADREAIEFR